MGPSRSARLERCSDEELESWRGENEFVLPMLWFSKANVKERQSWRASSFVKHLISLCVPASE